MPIDIILYAIIAVFLGLWLRNVLGTRHGDEKQRPNPFVQNPANDAQNSDTPKDITSQSEILTDGPRPQKAGFNPLNPQPHPMVDNKTAENGLIDISKASQDFELDDFLSKAQTAFKLIVESFADGDKATLKDLLAPGVYSAFEGAIDAREKSGEEVTTKVLEIKENKVIDARLKGQDAFITIQFTADEDYLITDKKGKVLAGEEGKITTMTDVWVFSKDVSSDDPRWFVVETRDDEIEIEGKTPMPEAKG